MIGVFLGMTVIGRVNLVLIFIMCHIQIIWHVAKKKYEPIRFSTNGAYLLDLICVDRDNYVKYSEVQHSLLNLDHCTVYCKLNLKASKPDAFKRQV